MHVRTRNTLLSLGFDTELIDVIAKHNHTVDALRSLPKPALAQCYTDDQIATIQTKIVRQPIPDEVTSRVIALASCTCCFCADGVTTRPFQIHHIEPYSKSQDNSEDNLLLVCPTHHAWLHNVGLGSAEQKHARRTWHSLVELAERYKEAGISFPFGSFVAVDFFGLPRASELIYEIRIYPPTAVAVSNHIIANSVIDNLLRDRFALLLGQSGDGKSTLAIGAAGQLAQKGWHIFRYRPPLADNRTAVTEILSFIQIAVRDSVLILDDVNTWMSPQDLEDVTAAVKGKAAVIATWTRALSGDDTRVETHFPKWIEIEWSKLAQYVMDFLRVNETEVVQALREMQDRYDTKKIGLGMFDESLLQRMSRYERTQRQLLNSSFC